MKKEILQTLSYADVFDYPFSTSEVWKFLISQRKTRVKDVQRVLSRMSADLKLIDADNKYFFLKGRKEIIETRRKREAWSKPKIKLAEKIAGILRKIPWVKMIGVTGALAMENSNKEDDIDLLIITSKNRLWLTRGLVVTFLRLTGLYRRPGKIKDKICPNMLLDEGHLAVPKKEQDLFSAHEVCQLKVIWEKDETYQKFLKENQWSRKFLPNWKP